MGRKLRSTPKKAKRLQQPAGNLVFVRFGELPEDECSEVGGVFQGSWTPTAYETIKKVQGGRREHLWQRLRFHEQMLENHTATFAEILNRHRAGVSRCEAMLEIQSSNGKETR